MALSYRAGSYSNNGTMDTGYMTANGNASSVHDIGVELYTMVWSLLAMLTLSLLGAVTNVALLLSMRCKRSVRNVYYILFYNVCVLNLVLCLFWMPLHFAQLVENFAGRGVWPGLCYVNVCVLHGCVAGLVCSVIFITIQRLYHMWRLSAKGTNYIATAGILASWLLVALAALGVAIEFPATTSHYVCVHSVLTFTDQAQQDLHDSTAMAVMATIHFVLLIITLISLLILLLLKRQALSQLLKLKYASNDLDLGVQGQDISTGSEPKSPQHPMSGSNQSGSDQVSNSRLPSTADSLLSGQQDNKESTSNVNMEANEAEEDDDTFDMKMRQRHRDSGRRHTVANIGLGDAGFGCRRGSLGNISDRSPTSVAHNYQYVRKWSVDIVALQDQLENPKNLAPIMPFAELHNKLKVLDQPVGNHDNKAELEEEEVSATSQVSTTSDSVKPPKKKKTVQLDNRIEEIQDIHEDIMDSMEPLSDNDLPSIVVNGNNASAPEAECFNPNNESVIDKEQLAQIDKELTKSSKLIALLLLVILCIVPYVVIQILRNNMSSDLSYNLSQVCVAVFVVQAPLQPVIYAWLDPRLLQAMRRLKTNMTHWRCVCYCNIGKSKGKACFGRAAHYEGTPTA